MSGVKRYHPHHPHLEDHDVVLASDYDRDTAELRSSVSAWRIHYDRAMAERDELRAQVEAMRDALEFASKSLSQITSSDGSGHSDIALSVLRLAGMNAVERETLVEGWKAKATWRIDAAPHPKP